VAQRFDLGGNSRALMPMVVDVADRRMRWTDLSLTVRGGGHDVAGNAVALARAAADQWECAGNRPTVLDVAGWHAAGRADRVLVAHPDGRWTGDGGPGDLTGRTVFAAVADAGTLAGLVPGRPAPGSVALTVTGRPDEPWTAATPAMMLGDLQP
jgi:hypothetical protein